MQIEKEVREFLRAGDILIARLKTRRTLTRQEVGYIQTYITRIGSRVEDTESGEPSEERPSITIKFSRDSEVPP